MTFNFAIEGAVPATTKRSSGIIEFRRLRHQTKNALQRIMMHVLEASELDGNRKKDDIARDVVQKIELAASISDALFGLREHPEPLPARLKSLSRGIIALHADGTQHIEIDVTVTGSGKLSCAREDAILRIIPELVLNAVKHDMYMRLIGRISIRLTIGDDGATLTVGNDGWWMTEAPQHGGGLQIVEDLAVAEGGDMRIKIRPQTLIEVRLPPESSTGSKGNFQCSR